MKHLSPFALLGLALLVLPGAARATDTIALDHGSVWQTSKTGADTQGFLQIHNNGATDDMLTAASCTIGASTALVDAKGNPLAGLTIPAGQTVTLAQGGPHLLISNLHFTVDFGSILPCAFTFRGVGDVGGYLNAVPTPVTNQAEDKF